MKIQMKVCETCDGTGRQPDPRAGQQLRTERELTGISIRKLAPAMGLSFSYVADVERGNRPINQRFVRLYLEKLEELVNGAR